MNDSILVIVPGATGSLGEAYLKRLVRDYNCIGVSRAEPLDPIAGVRYLQADLLDKDTTTKQVGSVINDDIERIVLIHVVGKFKFEEEPGEIDQEVVASNVNTFHNASLPVFYSRKPVVMVGFGSVSSKYDVPFWRSYTEGKNQLRTLLRLASDTPGVGTLFVNTSTIKTRNETQLRPHADQTYWLEPERVVDESLPVILNGTNGFTEIEVVQEMPGFDETWYTDHGVLLERWRRDMGVE